MQAFVYARVECREDAEELAQDVMLRIYDHLDESITHPPSWVYRVAHNAVTDYYRSRGRRPDFIVPLRLPFDADELATDDLLSGLAFGASEPPDMPTTDASFFYAILDAVDEAFAHTQDPELNKELLELAAEGLSNRQIGVLLGVDERYVSNTLNRLRKRLAPKHPEWAKGRRLRGPERGTRRTAPDEAQAQGGAERAGSAGDPPESAVSLGDDIGNDGDDTAKPAQ